MGRVKLIGTAGTALLAASLFASAPAFAQGEEGAPEEPVQEIVVTAPRPITAELEDGSAGGRKEAVISLQMTVQYADLDLATAEDADRLKVRIRSVARDACKYLDRMYPLDPDPDCEERAYADAKPQVEQAIAGAAQ